jgi:hypothetical protein
MLSTDMPRRAQMADSCTCGQLSTGITAYHDFVYELLTAEGCAASNGLRDHSLNVLHCLIPCRVVFQLQALLIHPCHAHRQVLCVPAPMPQRSSDTLFTTLPWLVARQDGPSAPGTPYSSMPCPPASPLCGCRNIVGALTAASVP